VSETRLFQHVNRSTVSGESSRLDPVKSHHTEPHLAHGPRCFGPVPLTSLPWGDPISEFGPPIDGREVAQLYHPDQRRVAGPRDGKCERLPRSKTGAFLIHEFNGVASEIWVREEVDTPPSGGMTTGSHHGLHVPHFRKAQGQPTGSDG
jgi:hypothetical protein